MMLRIPYRSYLFRAFIGGLLGTAVLALIVWLLSGPGTLVVVTAETQSMSYTVAVPSQAVFAVRDYQLIDLVGADPPKCISGLIEPPDRAVVTYLHTSEGIVVAVEADDAKRAATWRELGLEGQPSVDLSSAFTLVPAPATCGEAMAGRLPIWGDATLGGELRPPSTVDDLSPTLLSGSVAVFGRTLFGGRLYPSQTINLPAGARLASDRDLPERERAWWGLVHFDPDKRLSMQVTASTEARRLELIAPGARIEPSVIEVRTLSRVLNDPFLLTLGVILGAAGVILQISLAAAALLREERRP